MLFGSIFDQHILAQAVAQTMAQFAPFEVGQIKAHAYHGMSGAAISRILFKPDGESGLAGNSVHEYWCSLCVL